nr:DNA mismatch repair endonuclease MutL [Desulfobacterales bacterium]
KIIVELKDGGQTLIRVSDNGTGMEHNEALLSLERYATSKVYRDEDLFTIATLGFRGEALPSIASVSHMCIITKTKNSLSGTRIVVQGGNIKQVSETGAPEGTMVEVSHLFSNTPARRKFLKTLKTELGHITDCVTKIALAYPQIHFRIIHNSRVIGNWPAVGEPLQRIVDILGLSVRDQLFPLDYQKDLLKITGAVAAPGISRSTSRSVNVFINGRTVTERLIEKGIQKAYHGRLLKGKFPLAVIFVSLPFDQVDVNVHPTKSVVRFEDPKLVHDAVVDVVTKTLEIYGRPYVKEAKAQEGVTTHSSYMRPSISGSPILTLRESENGIEKSGQAPLFPDTGLSSLQVIGQVSNTYILCESSTGLVLIDQHAAHERILFESLKVAYRNSDIPIQQLLVPEILELNFRESDILDSVRGDLQGLGLEMEPFGWRTYLIKSVPSILINREIGPLIKEISELADEIQCSSDFETLLAECFKIMSCHGAIRANQELRKEEMEALLKQLDRLENPSHCPHGRPTWIIWTMRRIEKEFKRLL